MTLTEVSLGTIVQTTSSDSGVPMLRTHFACAMYYIYTHDVCPFVARVGELPKAYFSPWSCASFMSILCMALLKLLTSNLKICIVVAFSTL